MAIQYGTYEHLAKKLLFVDGITRCGKSMFSGIISSLKDVELLNFVCTLEQIVPAMAFGSIEPDYARCLVNLYFNEIAYNSQLARCINFRPTDQSGAPSYKEPKVYEDRLLREEGDDVVHSLRTSNHYLPFQTHDIMVHLDHFEKLKLNYWMISLWRHPVDTIHSWWKRGYGTRFQDDPRFFTLTLQYKDRVLPWYAKGCEKECAELNPIEFCVFLALRLIDQAVEQYKKNPETHSKIHITTFEDFCQNTDQELDRLCAFLKTERTVHTPSFMKKANCPRVLDQSDREKKLQDFEKNIRKDFFEKLLEVSAAYEGNLYGLRESTVSKV